MVCSEESVDYTLFTTIVYLGTNNFMIEAISTRISVFKKIIVLNQNFGMCISVIIKLIV